MEKVLVLLSSFNGSKYIEEQIDSILNQKDVDVFLLIRDDGSTDDTIDILDSYKEISNVKICCDKNVGCTRSFIKLLCMAKDGFPNFDYYAFSDQDDYWLSDKLSRAIMRLENIEKNTGPLLYCSNLTVTDSNLKPMGLMWKDDANISLENAIVENHGTGCTMVFNKELLDFFYDHQPNNIKLHDKWLFHTCILFGNVIYDKEPHILYRQHSNNVEGAGFGWRKKIINALKSLEHISEQHIKEEEAKELLNTYDGLLTKEQFDIIKSVADYKKNIVNRIFLLVGCRGIKMTGTFDNIKMKIRILLGSL